MKDLSPNYNGDITTYSKKYNPLTSIGIICIKIDDIRLQQYLLNDCNLNMRQDNFQDKIEPLIYTPILIDKFNKYNNIIQFLLVKRKYSLNYIDFIRGKYENSYKSILMKFNYMSKIEVDNIVKYNFDELWNKLWNSTSCYNKYMNERNISRAKFNKMKQHPSFKELIKKCNPYDTTEWEIPKGRKNSNESNIDCAMREFTEETSITSNDYTILKYINPIQDNFTGTNYKKYKHIFYTGIYTCNTLPYKDTMENDEIDEIRWCNWEEVISLIRPYNDTKIRILTNLFIFIINLFTSNDLKDTLYSTI